MHDRGAGIVLQSEALNLLEGLKLAARADISVESRERQYLNKDGSVGSSGVSQQFMTSWGALFNSLRRGFPDDHYHTGFKLVNFNSGEREVTARFENGREETGDLLIAGDGAWSAVRQQLLPKIAPEYAGYVAWRGCPLRKMLCPPHCSKPFSTSSRFFKCRAAISSATRFPARTAASQKASDG